MSVYIPLFPPAVPDLLRDPGQWRRFALLRDRVEFDVDALEAVRTVLAPVEAELWADADQADQTGERAPTDAFARRASRRVDAALTQLGV